VHPLQPVSQGKWPMLPWTSGTTQTLVPHGNGSMTSLSFESQIQKDHSSAPPTAFPSSTATISNQQRTILVPLTYPGTKANDPTLLMYRTMWVIPLIFPLTPSLFQRLNISNTSTVFAPSWTPTPLAKSPKKQLKRLAVHLLTAPLCSYMVAPTYLRYINQISPWTSYLAICGSRSNLTSNGGSTYLSMTIVPVFSLRDPPHKTTTSGLMHPLGQALVYVGMDSGSQYALRVCPLCVQFSQKIFFSTPNNPDSDCSSQTMHISTPWQSQTLPTFRGKTRILTFH
jgi:hypothetical protein